VALTVLDAGVVIAVLDAADGHHAAARAALSEALARGDELVLPASAYAESLVGPSRRGQAAVAALHSARPLAGTSRYANNGTNGRP